MRRISWTQVETGSAITWKYPSCVLQGADSVGEFYSVALTNNCQQADTGTKMVHVGPRTVPPSSARESVRKSSSATAGWCRWDRMPRAPATTASAIRC